MPNPMESLQTLLRMQTPQHVTTDDPYMSRRRADIMSGLDEFLPDADSAEYRGAQMTEGSGTFSGPGMSHTFSRDDMRQGGMSKMRLMLGMKQMEQESEERTAVAGQQAAMDRVLAAQQASTGRTQTTQNAMSERSDADRASRDTGLETRLRSMEDRQTASDAASMERTRYTADEATRRKTAGGGASWGWLRSLFPGNSEEVTAQQPMEQPAEQSAPRRRIISRRESR